MDQSDTAASMLFRNHILRITLRSVIHSTKDRAHLLGGAERFLCPCHSVVISISLPRSSSRLVSPRLVATRCSALQVCLRKEWSLDLVRMLDLTYSLGKGNRQGRKVPKLSSARDKQNLEVIERMWPNNIKRKKSFLLSFFKLIPSLTDCERSSRSTATFFLEDNNNTAQNGGKRERKKGCKFHQSQRKAFQSLSTITSTSP